MKLTLDFRIRVGDEIAEAQAVQSKPELAKQVAEAGALEGALVLFLDGAPHCEEFVEPLLRLGDQWIRKLPWVLGGDTETVAYRNTEHCFAFTPAGDSVEVSFFLGSESEVEE